MALWQWDIDLATESEILSVFGSIPDSIEHEVFDSRNWCAGLNKGDMETFFNSLLPPFKSYSSEEFQDWGNYDEDRLNIEFENDRVLSINIRIDLRDINVGLISRLVQCSKQNGLLFYLWDTQSLIQPDLDTVLAKIKTSRKMGFVQNPESFFKDKDYLGRQNNDIKKKLTE